MTKLDLPNSLPKRTRVAIVKDLAKEEKIEDDLISLYSTLLQTGIAECIEPDLVDVFYQNLSTIRDESIVHKQMVAVILNKLNK